MPFSKIVIKTKDGDIIKGTTGDFSPRSKNFHFTPLGREEGPATINIIVNTLKAIFFVKDFGGYRRGDPPKTNGVHPRTGEKLIKVRFHDGEEINGIAQSFHLDRLGFFIIPLDRNSNNERIYVIISNLETLNVDGEDIPITELKQKQYSCPTCQAPVEATWRWCPFDGTPLTFI